MNSRQHPLKPLLGLLALVAVLFLPFGEADAQKRRPNMKKAGELAAQAQAAFAENRFKEAAELLNEAYLNYPEPNFIWNTGRAWELAGDLLRAELSYRTFIQQEVSAEDADKAALKLAQLEALRTVPGQLQDSQDAALIDALASSNSKMQNAIASNMTNIEDGGGPSMSTDALIGWTGAGIGLVSFAAVATLHLASIDTVDQYHEAATRGDRAGYNAYRDTLNARVTTSQVLLVSGLVFSGAGGYFLYREYFAGPGLETTSDPNLDALNVAPLLSPDAAGLTVGGAF